MVGDNGAGQKAYFSFEAFRFVEHSNDTVSRFYLHCVTRLCEVDYCPRLTPVSSTVTIRSTDRSNIHRQPSDRDIQIYGRHQTAYTGISRRQIER